MFDTTAYLKALDYDGPLDPTADTLRELHRRHLIAIPYDSSLNTGRGEALWAGVDSTSTPCRRRRARRPGGVCYELNGLFLALLRELGYETGLFSAGIRQVDDTFGPDLEHVLGFVRLDGELWLIDVGFVGPSYLEPLRVVPDEVQPQFGTDFRVVRADSGHHVVQRRDRGGDWRAVYRFHPRPRAFADWLVPSPELDRFARALAGSGIVVRGRAFEGGQRILIGTRLVVVEDGTERLRGLADPEEHARVLAEILRKDAATA
uniref:Putative N-acetyltransferase n=1 Tax=Kitasatospora putterlickiae TaxID=221725 RepID=Q0PLZ9_9ACTN|nr:putative N-acetyltransferase [Kitasatospora putterlickiae]